MSKSTRLANRKAAIFSATLLGTLLILAVSFTSEPLQQVEAQQLAASTQALAMPDYSAFPDAGDEIADMFPDAPADVEIRAADVLD